MKHSELIRKQFEEKGIRYWANDNISDYLDLEDIELLQQEATEAFEKVLDALLIDRNTDPNSHGTAARLAKMYMHELFEGRYYPSPNVTAFPNEGTDEYTGMIVIRAELKSQCSHHWQPVHGTCYIGIIPNGKVLGLSKYIRLAQWHARRGTLQEELTVRIANSIKEETGSENIGVHIAAEHGCCTNRGVQAHSSLTQTTYLIGEFLQNPEVKKEFMDCIKLQETK